MTLKQLNELRAGKIAQMGEIQAKGDSIVATDISTMKSLQEEITDVDMQIEAIELTRMYAVNKSKKPEEKQSDFVAIQEKSFSAYLRGKKSFDEHKASIRAATGSYDTNHGEELVPKEFVRILKERVLEYGMIIPELDKITTSGGALLEYPTMDDTSNSAVWMDEHASFTLADFNTATIAMNAFKLGTGVIISNELVEDAYFNILVYAANLMGIRLGRTLESAVISGDGVKKPLGILNTVAIGTGVTATVKAIISVDTATTLVIAPEDLEALIDAVQPSQRAGSKFYLSDVAMRAATKWKDTTGRKLLQPLSGSTDAHDVVYSFAGYPMQVNFELGDLAVGDNPALFGNVKNYTLRIVRDVTVKASDQVKFLSDETVVVGSMRVDGRVTSVNTCFSKLTIKA